MEGKLFMVDRGTYVTARDSNGVEIVFGTIEEFDTYYSGNLDLSGEYYIDYEPERKVLFRSAKDNFQPLTNIWDGVIRDYEDVIADIANMKAKREDPYFGLSRKQAVRYRLDALRRLTYHTITQNMPEWRQIRWNEFVKLHEKVTAGNALNALEQINYDSLPDGKETHAACYKKCIAAFQWIARCIERHERKKIEIVKTKSIDALRKLENPDYPAWEF